MNAWNTKNAHRKLSAAVAVALLTGGYCTNDVYANEVQDRDTYTLPDVVVTAERVPTQISQTAANVAVVTAEEIAENHYRNAAEAISHVNGVVVMQSGMQDMVRLNGDDRVLVLVDGRRINSDQGTGSGRAGASLKEVPPMSMIERIEIVKGGGSALYGSDAAGGVINIITKRGKENRTTIDVAAGAWSTQEYRVMHEGSTGDWSWSVAGGIDRRGYMRYKSDGETRKMPDSDYRNNELSLRVDKKLGAGDSLTLSVVHHRLDGNSHNLQFGNTDHVDRLYNDWSASYNFKENTTTPGVLRVFDNYKSMKFSGAFQSRLTGVDYQNGWQLGKNHRLVAGAEWHRSSSTNLANGYDGERLTNTALYVQDTFEHGKWSLIPGVRMDHHSTFGTHYTPKLAVNYAASDKTQLYASWGRVFAAPQADDLFYHSVSPWGGMYGNRNLKPESGHTETIGVRHAFDAKKSLELSVFQSKIHDAIRWTTPNFSDYYATNIDLEKKRGLELTYRQELSKEWSYDLGYSYIRTERDKGTGQGLVWENTNARPNGYRIGIRYGAGAWTANLNATMGAGLDRTVFGQKSYTIVDLNVDYAIDAHTSAYVKLLNLTNAQYPVYNSKYYPGQGRFFQAGLTYEF